MGLLSLSIHVISSNVVQFPQQTLPNNIDLDITAHVDKIREYTEKLKSMFGELKEQTEQIATWSFHIEDIEIDAILSDPKISHVPEQLKVFETLKFNPVYLKSINS